MRYTKTHEWLKPDGDLYLVGISEHAAALIGDAVFVELPVVGRRYQKGEPIAVIESVKAASEVYAPAEGEVTAVNEALSSSPELINQSPELEGWMFQFKISAPALDSLSQEEYQTFVSALDSSASS